MPLRGTSRDGPCARGGSPLCRGGGGCRRSSHAAMLMMMGQSCVPSSSMLPPRASNSRACWSWPSRFPQRGRSSLGSTQSQHRTALKAPRTTNTRLKCTAQSRVSCAARLSVSAHISCRHLLARRPLRGAPRSSPLSASNRPAVPFEPLTTHRRGCCACSAFNSSAVRRRHKR